MLKIILAFVLIIFQLFYPRVTSLRSRIIQGVLVKPHEIPFIVSIQTRNGNFHFCGGSLIDWKYILTAAHCVTERISDTENYIVTNPLTIYIKAGDVNVGNKAALAQKRRSAVKIKVHPDYKLDTMENDIALIKLSVKYNKQPQINLIQMSSSTPNDYEPCYIAGWGTTITGTVFNLQKANVEIKNWETCNGHLSYRGKLPEKTICAGAIGDRGLNATNVEDACQGDSGGPLVCNNQLCGVVSFGNGCGEARFPGVYTEISQHRNWIEKNIGMKTTLRSINGGFSIHERCDKLKTVLIVIMVIGYYKL